MNRILIILSTIIAITLAGWFFIQNSPEVNLSFTQDEVQAQLSPQFPVSKCLFNSCIELHNPRIYLQSGSDLIGIETEFIAKLGKRTMPGTMKLKGQPYYEKSSGKFYLQNVQVTEFTMTGNAPDFDEVVKVRGPKVAAAIFGAVPLYSVQSHPKYGDIAQYALRSVTVVNGRIEVVFVNPLLLFGS